MIKEKIGLLQKKGGMNSQEKEEESALKKRMHDEKRCILLEDHAKSLLMQKQCYISIDVEDPLNNVQIVLVCRSIPQRKTCGNSREFNRIEKMEADYQERK